MVMLARLMRKKNIIVLFLDTLDEVMALMLLLAVAVY